MFFANEKLEITLQFIIKVGLSEDSKHFVTKMIETGRR